jgi:hypothetical protein
MIDNIRKSIIENIRARLPDSTGYPDIPPGEHDVPCHYLDFRERVRSKDQQFGGVLHDYVFDFVVEVKDTLNRYPNDTETDSQQKFRLMDAAFRQGERLTFWTWSGSVKTLAEGKMVVSKFSVMEGRKDSQGNRARAELIITF